MKMTPVLRKIFAFTLLLCCWGLNLLAAEEPYQNFIKGTIKKNDSLMVKDEKFKNPNYTWSEITNVSVNNTISLELLSGIEIQKSFALKVLLKVAYFSDPNQTEPTIIDSVNLNIDYKKDSAQVYRTFDSYKFTNGYYVKIYVLDVQSPELGENLPEIFQLTSTIVVDRKYRMLPMMPTNFTGELVSNESGGKVKGAMQKMIASQQTSSFLQLTLDPLNPAEEYDIEWVAIDKTPGNTATLNGLVNNTYSSGDTGIDNLFKNNNSRVTVDVPIYRIPLVFNSDVLLVRIRAVSYATDGLRIENPWSYKTGNPQIYAAWDITNNWHESKFNWQYAASYAEEGKIKQQISYFDGSLRNRQNVTVNNADTVAIVQESIYDQYGRAVASILPAPTRVAGVAQESVRYFSNFNRGLDGVPYKYLIPDTNICEISTPELSTDNGAAQYYSLSNAFKGEEHRNFNKYIPDAGGYPVSITQYTADNTGRIRLQGGVGPEFQPGNSGNSRTTKYYYGKPLQWELDRIFGNDVGLAERYFKNMVVDPNNQVSISYLNASGKTIATALTGGNPSNVQALPSMVPAKYDTIPLIYPTEFQYSNSGLSINASSTYLSAVPGPVTIKYDIEQLISRYPGTGVFQPYSNCYYDLYVTVKDNCQKVVKSYSKLNAIGSKTSNPNKTGLYMDSVNVDSIGIGEYYINIEFRLSKDVIKYYTDQYIAGGQAAGVIKTKNDFIFAELGASLDKLKSCLSDCRDAVKKLGPESSFVTMFNSKLKEAGVTDTASYLTYIKGLHATLLSTAAALEQNCTTVASPCDQYRIAMLQDVSPGGQYALFDSLGNAQETDINVLYNNFRTVFPIRGSTDSIYLANRINLEDGDETSPNASNFNPQKLVKYWKSEWADRFLEYHPEICKLKFCDSTAASGLWDEKLSLNDSDSVLFVRNGVHYSDTTPDFLLNNDPFFASGPGADYKDEMLLDLQNYSSRVLNISESGVSTKSLNKYVDYLLYCADTTGTTNASSWTSPTSRWNTCQKKAECRVIDREWQVYRDLYLELKQKYFILARNAACNDACPVGEPIAIGPPVTSDCSYGLGLGPYSSQLGPNKFIRFDYSNNIEYIYTFVKGTADIEPLEPDSCSLAPPVFYSCIVVTLSDGSKRTLYNVWLFRCARRMDESGCYSQKTVYVSSNPSLRTYYVNNTITCDPYTVKVFEGSSQESPPTFPACSSYDSTVAWYNCYNVFVADGAIHLYNNVWVQVCYDNYGSPGCGEYLRQTNQTAFTSFRNGADEVEMHDLTSKAVYHILRKDTISKTSFKQVRSKGGRQYKFYRYFMVQTTPNSFDRLDSVWIAQEGLKDTSARTDVFEINKPQAKMSLLSTNCSPLLLTKQSRFVEPAFNNIPTGSGAAYYDEQLVNLHDTLQSNCEQSADLWIARLDSGLTAINASVANRALLKQKLIEICAYSDSFDHPYGASSLPGNSVILVNSLSSRNFGDVIKNVFNLAKFNDILNPWLIETPYPYSPLPKQVEKKISNTSADICDSLALLRPSGANDTEFYTYLKTEYGDAMKLSQTEFNTLLKGCGNCRFLLDKELVLPAFLDGGSKIYITKTEYLVALNDLTSQIDNFTSSSANYEDIVSNYMNHKWGFSLSYERYKKLGESGTPAGTKLFNDYAYGHEFDINYSACQAEIFGFAIGSAIMQYESYIAARRLEFEDDYVALSVSAKANVSLVAPQQLYHYTLYYYDQAGNLMRTVPPEGVYPLNDVETRIVDNARRFDPASCNYNGPTTASSKPTALQTLSNTLEYNGNAAVELWLYQNDNSPKQTIVTTPDKKYMFQVCVRNNRVGVDIYKLEQLTAGDIRITRSNHVKADITTIAPVLPWTHIVVQADKLSTGVLEIWVNGKKYTANPNITEAGCSWEIKSVSSLQLPDAMGGLKHLRLYTGRLMTGDEIRYNAGSACFAAMDNTVPWYRFLVPTVPGPTTISATNLRETQFKPAFPAHALATSYAYNGLNQVSKQFTPDADTSKFWYDKLARVVFSQNKKQFSENKFSFTQYDSLGRVTEVGEKTLTSVPTELAQPGYLEDAVYKNLLLSGTDAQLTQTFYDEKPIAETALDLTRPQANLRNRVVASVQKQTRQSTEANASYYDYDLSGNVKTLYQQIVGLEMKKIGYEYDLASGKVNFVSYQDSTDKKDKFFYEYKYDSENRLTEAWTDVQATVVAYGIGSRLESPTKRLDASYKYYLHGPLARIELGHTENKVQGLDYAYTLQGWLKGVNGNTLNPATGQVQDGSNGVAKDAIAFSLGYYPGDYQPIVAGSDAYKMQWQPGGDTGNPLYNGNISNSTVAIKGIGNDMPAGYAYRYDQLNRLTKLKQFALNNSTTTWNSSTTAGGYSEDFTYDGNGNILTSKRYSSVGTPFDNLVYNYQSNTNGKLAHNRLLSVNDVETSTAIPGDLRGLNSYQYDAIGNLASETVKMPGGNAEKQYDVEWNVYGKIKAIDKTGTADDILYTYDPTGNRVRKMVGTTSTWYVRDAQGNALAVYDNAGGVINWREQQLYGSNRLGLWKPNINIATTPGSSVWGDANKKNYELTNHLGNVLAVITNETTITGGVKSPVVVSAQDYYAFGMIQPGRNVSSANYRYGFNGKENDNEVKGTGNQQDYGMRVYDPRIGKFLSVDPITKQYPELTPYQFAGNMPIQFVDLDGLEPAKNPKQPGAAEYAGSVISKNIQVGATLNNLKRNGIVKSGALLGKFSSTKNDKYITDTRKSSADKFNMFVNSSTTFNVDESNAGNFNSYEAFVVSELMDNFTSGEGPENYNFPTNGIISSKFLESDILKSALADYKSGKSVLAKQYSFGALELAKDADKNGTIFNITGLTGSGTITIIPNSEGIKIKIFNITSLTSGTFGKEVFGESNYPKSSVRDAGKTVPFSNISQTFNLFIPNPTIKAKHDQ